MPISRKWQKIFNQFPLLLLLLLLSLRAREGELISMYYSMKDSIRLVIRLNECKAQEGKKNNNYDCESTRIERSKSNKAHDLEHETAAPNHEEMMMIITMMI